MKDHQLGCEVGIGFSRDDEVGMFLGGCYKGVIHGAYGGEILVGDRFGCAPAFCYIAVETANETNVETGADEYFKVKEVA